MKVLDLPDDVNSSEIVQFNVLMKESTDVFALVDNELGCTNVVSHKIDTGYHHSIKQMPYKTSVIYRDKISQMVKEMEERGVVQSSSRLVQLSWFLKRMGACASVSIFVD